MSRDYDDRFPEFVADIYDIHSNLDDSLEALIDSVEASQRKAGAIVKHLRRMHDPRDKGSLATAVANALMNYVKALEDLFDGRGAFPKLESELNDAYKQLNKDLPDNWK